MAIIQCELMYKTVYEGQETGAVSANGTFNTETQTATIPIGYLPEIGNSNAKDPVITLRTTSVEYHTIDLVQKTINYDEGTQDLTVQITGDLEGI